MEVKRATEAWVLAGIVLLGSALRLYDLGALGLAGNEDYLAIAVRGVLADGLPQFPSGVFYPRALPFTYITAGLTLVFGETESVLRLTGALFSVVAIVGVYLLGRRLFSYRVALLAALLMAVSGWEVQVARTARMYSMLSACCVLSVWLLYRAMARRERWAGFAALGLAVLSCFLHQIALALAVMYACFRLHFEPERRRTRLLAFCILAVLVAAGVNRAVEKGQYTKWWVTAQETAGPSSTLGDGGEDRAKTFVDRYLSPFQSLNQHRIAFVVVTTLAAGGLFWVIVAAFRRPREWLFPAAFAAAIAMVYLQQMTLAAMLTGGYLFVGRALEPRIYRSRAIFLVLLSTAAGLAWLLFGWFGATAATLKDAVKPLVTYPPSFLRYFEQYVVMSGLAIVAGLVGAMRYLRSGRVDALGLLSLVFVTPALALGFHPQALERTFERYVFFLNPYFLILVAFGAVWIGQQLWTLLESRGPLRPTAIAVYALALVFLTDFGNGRVTLAVHSAAYGINESLPDRNTPGSYFHADLQGAARFVEERYRPSDIVVAMDILGHYAYSPHADYQLSLFDKPDAEGWIGARTLDSVEDLEAVLRRHKGKNVWIVLAGTHLRWFEEDARMDAILRLIERRAGEPRYAGRDGLSHVYRVTAEAGN